MGLEELAKSARERWAKEIALPAAAAYWSGMTVTRGGRREDCLQVLETADKMVEWLLEERENKMGKNPNPEYYEDAAGEWRWRVKGANGEIIDASSEGFASKQKAEENYDLN